VCCSDKQREQNFAEVYHRAVDRGSGGVVGSEETTFACVDFVSTNWQVALGHY